MLTSLLLTSVFSACSAENTAEPTSEESSLSTEKESAENTENTENSEKIAQEGETVAPETVGYEGMTEVTADMLVDGEYTIDVDSSSSMFKISECNLTVDSGNLKIKMTMNSASYRWLFLGTAQEAVDAPESDYINFTEENGVHIFEFEIDALDKIVDCCAFSEKKEKWYDRQLVFRADSLPSEAFSGGLGDSLPESTADGVYNISVELKGGSGKASVQSPTKLTVKDGKAIAEIVWGSNNYDYMVVDGEKYEPVTMEEFSVFEIPVEIFNYDMPISADTIAMSTPHEIDYTLYFDLSNLKNLS